MRRSRLPAFAAAMLAIAAGTAIATRRPAPAPPIASAATASPAATAPSGATPSAQPAGGDRGVAVAAGRVDILSGPGEGAATVSRVRAGIPLPVSSRRGRFLAVRTPCQVGGWVAASGVRLESPSSGRDRTFDRATLVLDAGHGGPADGAVGPSGLKEKDVNLDVVSRLQRLLAGPHDIDWSTGRIGEGSRYGTPRVLLTRSDDHFAGLAYRAELASAVRADAMLSVHHNANPDGPSTGPGSETYYQSASSQSKRLAGLAYEEVLRALRPMRDVSWAAAKDAGAKYRLNGSGADYYALLRMSSVPAVIVEVAYVSNASEEAMLQLPETRQAVAEALYRALVRFVTTSDPGSGFVTPLPRASGPSGATPSTCVDPG